MAHLATEAICLRRFDYSETSQVVHLYTRDSGKVHAIAKGSKRRKTRFNGPFDILGRYSVVRIPKPPGQLDLLIESDLLEDYARLRTRWDRFAAACYLLDVVETLTVEESADRGLYEQLVAGLEALAGGMALEPAVLGFEARALRILGFFPRLSRCGVCQGTIGEEAWFGGLDGGAVCTGCRPRDPGRLKVRRGVLELLAGLGAGAPPSAPPPELRILMNRYMAFLAERRLRTWAVFPRG